MAYQALLFCPDEKIASTVTQVLSDLDFTVVPCVDPFGAVKRMMKDRFDAVVVDCDNEQNAALLFKSARGSADNQNSLAVAVVEGQAGVAKAFRLGANLVLTKPVNVEQAKGTLRVARGLLKKNEAARAAGATAAPVAPKPSPVKATPPASPEISFEPVEAAKAEPAVPAAPVTAKKVTSMTAAKTAAQVAAFSAGAAATSSASGAAAAPAKTPSPQVDELFEAATPEIHESDAASETEAASEAASASAEAAPYKFTFGGSNVEEAAEETTSGGSKKGLIAVAALLALAAAGYYGRNSLPFLHKDAPVAAPAKAAPATSKPLSAVPVQPVAPTPAPAVEANDASDSANQPAVSEPAKPSAVKGSVAGTSPKTSPALAAKGAAAVAPAPQAIVMGRSTATPSKTVEADTPAPTAVNIAPSTMPAIATTEGTHPILQTLKISQGVSQGLLVKKVQPVYPSNALRVRIEGDVALLATIGKTGDVTAVNVVSGSPVFAQAAVNAVRQWKYKPYQLNGEAIEIQTDVTVKFRLPH